MIKNHSFVFMGCKHCGKSTQGQAVAKKLGLDFFDIDLLIEENAGMPFRQYYKEKGAANFMMAEEEACEQVADFADNNNCDVVVSTGGGICDNLPALEKLRGFNSFVFLRLDVNYSVGRVMEKIEETGPGKFTNLPAYVLKSGPKTMGDINDILVKTFTDRTRLYEKIADIIIDIKDAPIEENTNLILKALSK